MKLSLFLDRGVWALPAYMDLKKLAYDLTMSTVEVEDVEYLARRFDNMVVGVINSVEAHPNADKLRVCKVDLGSDVKEIVCGRHQPAGGHARGRGLPGRHCALARRGRAGGDQKLEAARCRLLRHDLRFRRDRPGRPLPRRAGGGDPRLSAFDVPAGTPLAKALDLDDVLLEIDNKSMTNRPDLWGHYGIAREIAALYNLPLKKIEPYQPDVQSVFKVEIDDPERCTRYIGVEMSGVSVKPPLQDAEPHLEGRHAPDQRPRGHHELCDARHRQPDARL